MEQEIGEILAGRGAQLGVAQPFRNAVAQARLALSEAEHESFFRDMLADISEPVLPFGLSDVHGEGRQIACRYQALSSALNLRLRRQARRLGVSLASLCHLAWRRCWRASAGETRSCSAPYCWGVCRAAKARNGHWDCLSTRCRCVWASIGEAWRRWQERRTCG